MGKLDIFRNEEGYTTTRLVLTILPEEVIARKRFGIGIAGKFGFFETDDWNFEGGNEAVEFIFSGKEAIAVKMEDERFTRRFTGSWVRGEV